MLIKKEKEDLLYQSAERRGAYVRGHRALEKGEGGEGSKKGLRGEGKRLHFTDLERELAEGGSGIKTRKGIPRRLRPGAKGKGGARSRGKC